MTGGPVALVTGAARGIGRAAALALAAHGYDIVVNYSVSEAAGHQAAQEVRSSGARALAVRADVADEAAVLAMVAAVTEEFGRLDAVVNNAGITIDVPPTDLDKLDMSDWDRVFAVNVRGVFQVTRACLPLLTAAPGAAIVNMASIAGLRPGPQPFPYAASKAAVVNLTRTLACVSAGDPGERGCPGLDGGGLDAGPARRQLRPPDAAASTHDPAGPVRHPRRRCRHDRVAGGVEPVRHRRGGGS